MSLEQISNRSRAAIVQRSTRSQNRQLRKQLPAIENKLHQYGGLGTEVTLVIHFSGKNSGYFYVTSEDFLERIHDVVSWGKRVAPAPLR